MAMELIETVTLTSSASSIEFTSIPQDGVDLLLKVSARTTGTGPDEIQLRINGISTSTYSYITLQGTTSEAASFSESARSYIQVGYMPGVGATANTFSNSSVYFSNYTSSVAKSISVDATSEDNSSTKFDTFLNLTAGKDPTTSAIESITLLGSNQYAIGSTASIYKIS